MVINQLQDLGATQGYKLASKSGCSSGASRLQDLDLRKKSAKKSMLIWYYCEPHNTSSIQYQQPPVPTASQYQQPHNTSSIQYQQPPVPTVSNTNSHQYQQPPIPAASNTGSIQYQQPPIPAAQGPSIPIVPRPPIPVAYNVISRLWSHLVRHPTGQCAWSWHMFLCKVFFLQTDSIQANKLNQDMLRFSAPLSSPLWNTFHQS